MGAGGIRVDPGPLDDAEEAIERSRRRMEKLPVAEMPVAATWTVPGGGEEYRTEKLVAALPAHLPPAPVLSPPPPHVREEKDHFIVTDASGSGPFRVEKGGLKPDTLEFIQGMAQQSAPMELAPLVQPEPMELAPLVQPTQIASFAQGGEVPDAGMAQTQFVPLVPLDLTGGVDAGMPGPVVPGPVLPQEFTPEAMAAASRPAGMLEYPGVAGAAPVEAPAQARVFGPELQKGVAASLPAPAAAAAPTTAAPQLGIGGSGALGELTRGLAEQRAGLQAQVEVEKARDAALIQLQDRQIAARQALEAQQADEFAAHQQRGDNLFQATLNARIDPNRVWATADTGQRISAGIGILLSGIGVGLAGGPNLALQVIDRTIERDIDAQKTDLANRRGLLSHYLQQGRDMLAAHQLAKADLKEMFSAQLMRVSAEFGGQEAAARAQVMGGQLRTDAAKTREAIFASEYGRQKDRLALQMAMEQQRLLSAFAAAPRTPAGGVQTPAGLLEVLPKDMRERAVHLPDGSVGFAPDANRARDLTKALETTDAFRKTLARYEEMLEAGSPVRPEVLGGQRTEAQGTRTQLLLQLKELYQLGALQPGEIRLLEPMIPDITEVFTTKKPMRGGLTALRNTLGDLTTANIRSALGRGGP